MENILKEAQNNVVIEGILQENRLQLRDKDGRNYIAGDLLVSVTPDNTVAVNFFAFETRKDGHPNKIYQSLQTLKNDLQSVAAVGLNQAHKIRITGGKIESNEFYNANGQLISGFRVRSNFVQRLRANADSDFRADFQIECYLSGIFDETDNNDELTGRLVLKAIVPVYGGKINLLTFFVEDPAGIKYITENCSVGDTVKLAGFIDNSVQKIEKTEEMEFGEDIVNTYERVKRELIVTKGSCPYEGEEAFSTKDIKEAMLQREKDLEILKNKNLQTTVEPTQSGRKTFF